MPSGLKTIFHGLFDGLKRGGNNLIDKLLAVLRGATGGTVKGLQKAYVEAFKNALLGK